MSTPQTPAVAHTPTPDDHVNKLANRLELKAKAMALHHINDCRQADGLKPVKRIERLWWDLYGNEWHNKARAALALARGGGK